MSNILCQDSCMTFVVAIRENIKRLIAARAEGSQSIAARHSKVPQRTIGRIVNGEVAPAVDTIYRLATSYGYESWQLLVPGFDPDKPPRLSFQNGKEQALLDRLMQASEELAKYKVNK